LKTCTANMSFLDSRQGAVLQLWVWVRG